METNPGKVLKYCPRCGGDSFIFDGIKAFDCNKCHFTFYTNSAAAVAGIIVNSNNQILLTTRAYEPMKGFLDLPGGFVDPFESAEDAMVREIKEELNLEVINLRYLASFPNEYIFSGYSVYTTDLGFEVKVKNFDFIESKDDISGYIFIHPSEIDYSKIASDSISKILICYIQKTAEH